METEDAYWLKAPFGGMGFTIRALSVPQWKSAIKQFEKSKQAQSKRCLSTLAGAQLFVDQADDFL